MRILDRPSIQRGSPLRKLALAIAVIGVAGCADRATGVNGVHESVPTASSLSLAPRFAQLPDGGPTITVTSVSGVLTDGNGNAINATARMDGGVINTDFNFQVFGSSDAFTLTVSAFDADGIIAFGLTQPATLRTGNNADFVLPTLPYAGPDKGVTKLVLSPGPLTLDVNGTASLGFTGSDASGTSITPVRVGWTSRNPAIVSVDSKGKVQAGATLGASYIVGRSASNAADSVLVTVRGPADKVVVSPAATEIIRGLTKPLLGQVFDAGGTLIPNQPLAWSSSDATIAAVANGGVVTGLKNGSATITATLNGKSGTATVTIVTPLDHIELTPPVVNLAALQDHFTLTTKLVPKTGASVAGIVPTYVSSDESTVSVDDKGVVTALKNGTATITASAEGLSATVTVTVKQIAGSITITPKTASVPSIGDQRTFVATVLDASGKVIADPTIEWTTSDPTIASVANGVATALKSGTVTITATSGGKADVATFIVSPIPKMLLVLTNKRSIAVGGSGATVTGKFADANGNPLSDASPEWSTTTPGILSVTAGGAVSGIAAGTGHVVGTASGFTGSVDIKVTGGSGGSGLTLNLTTVEKLPHGIAEFFVVSGGEGPFSWTVNGIPNGNDMFGKISVQENGHAIYTAPGNVPDPATFQVCATQANPPLSGCVQVTISPIPSGGQDVIVFNDVNVFSGADTKANNRLLFTNLVSFSGGGIRGTQKGVMLYNGHGTAYPMHSTTNFANFISNLGYTITDYSGPLTASIDQSIKVVFLWLPTSYFSVTEINNLKQFAAEGGRIIYVGEHAGFYGSGIPIENRFFIDMGAQMTNSGGMWDCDYHDMPASVLRPHQVTEGLTGLTIACASEVIPGPNDYPFLYDDTNTHVLAAVAKIDITPLPVEIGNLVPSLRKAVAPAAARKIDLTVRPNVNPKDPAGRPIKP